MEEKPAKLLILYATQTGNALDAAERIGREAERRGCTTSVCSIDDFDASSLPHEDTVIFVVSTTGQGDTPDSMKAFWKFLLRRNISKNLLEGVHYAVFGLGDSGYQKYNFVAKKLDRRLSDLGAAAVVERGLGDDQHPSGYEGALDPWMSSLWNMLYQINPKFFPNGPDFVIPDTTFIDQPKFQITYHEACKEDSQSSTASGLACVQMQIGRARSMSPGKFSHDKNIPDCFLKMIKNQPLSRAGCGKDVRHFEFEFVSSKIEYGVGDVLEVLPGQDSAAVDAFIQRCNLDPESFIIILAILVKVVVIILCLLSEHKTFVACRHSRVTKLLGNSLNSSNSFPDSLDFRGTTPMAYLWHLASSCNVDKILALTATYSTGNLLGVFHVCDYVHPRGMESHHFDAESNDSRVPLKLKTFVELTMDVASASPRRYFFEARILYVMSFFATAEHEKERLQYFASPEGRDDLYEYNQKERRTVMEVLEDFPSVQMPFEWLVQLVPPLKTRAFSISSSPSAHPNEVHLTVNVVLWTTPFKRKRTGLCSKWLAGLERQEGVYIPAWFHKGSLPPPPPSVPLVLVGPGTGCAPFRGFVEERAMQDVSCSAAPIMMFFGCRNEANDFLYRDFWLSHAQNGGLLSIARGGGFYVAFSRDQPQKVYVQHKMREQSQTVWDLLLEGASIYVAGSSTKMPSDVMSALEEIISKEAGVPRETAVSQLRRLEKDGRYHVEAWS
ncbi:unnamed protein product [Dovyalis caffra]|uniref:NADPH-dependent diflavin oxidoreductase 1 n=1 Tax=Dovyalis caffra TaxID=77055 RepID=A0AAV1RDX1_9ROSI|nr:unnamed protein product [Dovyalis caffra]